MSFCQTINVTVNPLTPLPSIAVEVLPLTPLPSINVIVSDCVVGFTVWVDEAGNLLTDEDGNLLIRG